MTILAQRETGDTGRSIQIPSNQRSTMRILLVDDEKRIRSALKLLFENESEYTVVGEAENANALIAQVIAERPDIILLDWDLLKNRDKLIFGLKEAYPKLAVLIMSGRPEVSRDAIRSGADAFFSKTDPPERLLQTLAAI
jgi:DNA-binding NarL/FixJ family response regulator